MHVIPIQKYWSLYRQFKHVQSNMLTVMLLYYKSTMYHDVTKGGLLIRLTQTMTRGVRWVGEPHLKKNDAFKFKETDNLKF